MTPRHARLACDHAAVPPPSRGSWRIDAPRFTHLDMTAADHDLNNEAPEQSALDSGSQLSLGIGVLTSVSGENARHRRLGIAADQPRRIKYRKLVC